MKKLLFFLAALMFVTSCSKDTTTTPEVKGEKVVSFKVTAPKIQTRYGEGAEANKLFWAVYKNGQRLDDISVIDPAEAVAINMSVDVEISLMEGIDYDILFWAQNENAPYTFDGAKVTIDYDALSANKEAYDAFFRNYHVDADQTEPHRVELRRPFAQLNIGTADTAKAQSAGFTVENTSVTVEACTVLDLATGEASEPQELTFAMSQKASDTYGEAPDTFDIISMNYLLVNNEKKVVDVTFNAEGGNDAIEREYLNVPLQRNHRTYILGDILTSSKLFNVYINPAFDDEELFNDPSDDQRQPVAGSVIYYTSAHEGIESPYGIFDPLFYFGANIVSNTYEDGQGKIVFDGPVTHIGEDALSYSSMTSVILPNTVTKIGRGAFGSCNYLTSITIPDSVTDMEHNVFPYSPLLESFISPYATADKHCLIIDNKLIAAAPAGLVSCDIPDGVIEIIDYAFFNCTGLTNVTIPDSVTKIGSGAFNQCTSLTNINIPDSVTEIGSYAFCDCRSLASINIPNGVTIIDHWTFGRCWNLASITIPDNLTEIGNYAFYNCSSLASITIPDSVMKIGNNVFYACVNLASITIPDSVMVIGKEVVTHCENLASINGKFASDDNRCLIVDGVLESFAPVGLTSYTIPDSVTEIGNYTFAYYDLLTNITIPDSVTKIGQNAFQYSYSLEGVYCKATNPPVLVYDEYLGGCDTFAQTASNLTIYVPTESVDAYKNADGWKYYADRIVDGGF